MRRCTLRKDGFISVRGPYAKWGEFRTPVIQFAGSRLALNYSTGGAGGIQVEVQDAGGKPIPGFGLQDCPVIFGDKIDGLVTWKGGGDVSKLAGQPVRLRIRLRTADLYAFRFRR